MDRASTGQWFFLIKSQAVDSLWQDVKVYDNFNIWFLGSWLRTKSVASLRRKFVQQIKKGELESKGKQTQQTLEN